MVWHLPTALQLNLLWLAASSVVSGMQVTGYQAAANDRFSSGYPSAPVRNLSPDFIGKDFDWTAVGWSSQNARQSHGYFSPRHHLTAKHFTNTNTRRVFGNDNVIHTVNYQNRTDLGLGFVIPISGEDISITRLTGAFPVSAQMPRYAVLDLNSSSTTNSPSNYNGRSVVLYGHWGLPLSSTGSTQIGQTSIFSATINGTEHRFLTPRTAVQLEDQDSGSPAFMVWENPDGGQEITLIGNHAAIDTTNGFNIHNFIASREVMAGINNVMTPDGYALRVEGTPTNTWVGSSSISINNRRSWEGSSAPSDQFVTFNGATAGNGRQVNVNANHNLRGLYFRNTGGSSLGFQFNGTSTLTIGRGGVMNLDGSRQVFEAPLALGDHQYWDAGQGGVSVRNVATNGRLLNLRSPGPSMIRGNVSGSGGIALEGGQLHMEDTSSYTGRTWAHHGNLRVDGDIRTSERLIFGPAATLTGHGALPTVQGNGSVLPDGILTATSLIPSNGLGLHFRFSSDAPVFESPTTSPNDLFRLTGSPAISTALTAQQSVSVYLSTSPPASGATIRGGFFFDDAATSSSLVSNANWQILVPDPEGAIMHEGESYSLLDRDWSITLVPQTATFADGSVDGVVMQLHLAAEAGTYDSWAASVFPESVGESDRAPDATPNGDGVPNLLAYALGLDPLAEKSGNMPAGELGETQLAFRFRRNVEAQDLSLIVETSDDLLEWFDVVSGISVIDPDVDGDGRVELMQAMIPRDPMETKRFARLRVNFAEP